MVNAAYAANENSAAQANILNGTIDNSAHTSTSEQADNSDNSSSAPIVQSVQDTITIDNNISDSPAIDLATVAILVTMFNAATTSKFFMRNPKRLKLLMDALNIPVSDDVSFQRIYYYAENDLVTASYKNARNSGSQPVEVTKADIVAEAQKRYFDKHGNKAVVNEEY